VLAEARTDFLSAVTVAGLMDCGRRR
jgi:hypothetical protein